MLLKMGCYLYFDPRPKTSRRDLFGREKELDTLGSLLRRGGTADPHSGPEANGQNLQGVSSLMYKASPSPRCNVFLERYRIPQITHQSPALHSQGLESPRHQASPPELVREALNSGTFS